jgi:hypothetical protein
MFGARAHDFASDGLHYVSLQIKDGNNMILTSDAIALNPGGVGLGYTELEEMCLSAVY